jgi:hypothetical protein
MSATPRRLAGLVLVAASAVTALSSAFVEWYDGREGTAIRLQDLFSGLTPAVSGSLRSLLIPVGLSALLAVAGAARTRWFSGIGGLIAVATALLWTVRQAQAAAGLHSGLVGSGPWMALSAGAGMWLAAAVAGPRRRASRAELPDRLSPAWVPAAGTLVGLSEDNSEPRQVEGLA